MAEMQTVTGPGDEAGQDSAVSLFWFPRKTRG